MLTEALAIVFICGGIALWLEVSFLIASMVTGAVIANLARHHEYPFHAIEDIELPFMAIFFVLAGSLLEFSLVQAIGGIGILYILSRVLGKLLGTWLGAVAGKASAITRKWMGLALMPQAGAAIGMALVAANKFPQYRQTLLCIVIGTTVFFELQGPILTRWALRKAHP